MNWREYQEQAAELFRSIGCYAASEITIDGTRGQHKIDVWVTRSIYGLEHRWVVECKYWGKRVKKENVVVLKGIVDDVGADRGILLSSSGFQSGAISMAERSNITLSSLEEMRESIRDELERYTISSLEEKAAKVADGLHDLSVYESTNKDGFTIRSIRPTPGVDGNAVRKAGGNLRVLERGFRRIRIGTGPIPVRFEEDRNTLKVTNNIGEFLELASQIIGESEALLEVERAKVAKNA